MFYSLLFNVPHLTSKSPTSYQLSHLTSEHSTSCSTPYQLMLYTSLINVSHLTDQCTTPYQLTHHTPAIVYTLLNNVDFTDQCPHFTDQSPHLTCYCPTLTTYYYYYCYHLLLSHTLPSVSHLTIYCLAPYHLLSHPLPSTIVPHLTIYYCLILTSYCTTPYQYTLPINVHHLPITN